MGGRGGGPAKRRGQSGGGVASGSGCGGWGGACGGVRLVSNQGAGRFGLENIGIGTVSCYHCSREGRGSETVGAWLSKKAM